MYICKIYITYIHKIYLNIFLQMYIFRYVFFSCYQKECCACKRMFFLIFSITAFYFSWNKQSGQDLALIIIMRDLVPLWKTWSH